MLIEGCREWNAKLYIALVDFEEAFDTVNHAMLFEALELQGMPKSYIFLLRRLYQKQSANVRMDVGSREFNVERGVRQGDPISPLLFILVMDQILRPLEERWSKASIRRRGHPFGIQLRGRECLTNLRFADDVLLVSSSKADIRKMLEHFKAEASKYGLSLHMGKTKILANRASHEQSLSLELAGEQVDILAADAAEKYLGAKLCLDDCDDAELTSRISCAWAAFAKYRGELCNRHLSAKLRMKLFDSVVTPCVLYACSCWALTAERARMLQTARRRMLRQMFVNWNVWNLRGGGLEEWIDHMRQSTHDAEALASKHGSLDWVFAQRRRKWKFAGKLASCTDGRWSRKLLEWTPLHGYGRSPGHPFTRWSDELCALAGGNWLQHAENWTLWSHLEDGFALIR